MQAEINQIFKCKDCGLMVEVLKPGSCEPCCGTGKPEPLQEKTEDEGMEKHVPVIERTDKGVKVKVGSIEHPMEEEHFIEWIEVLADGLLYRKHLKPGDKPEAEFCLSAESIVAREHCSVHGLWKC